MRLSTGGLLPSPPPQSPLPYGLSWSSVTHILADSASDACKPKHTSSGGGFVKAKCADMDLFQLSPSNDAPLLVVCRKCSKTVRAVRFKYHQELCGPIQPVTAAAAA